MINFAITILIFRIKKEDFIYLAKVIVELFPNELSGTYYIPAVNNQPAQGKLFSAYQNYKTDLREAALISKRSKAPASRGDFFLNLFSPAPNETTKFD